MILKQFYLACLAHASYLIGDEQTHTAAVIDPQRDVDQYLAFAAEHGLQIKHVFLTHFHADFVAGHIELRDRAGATIYLGAAAKAEYRFTPLHDGDVVDLGRVRLQALETPGHTAESISLVVYDLDRDRALDRDGGRAFDLDRDRDFVRGAASAGPQAVLTGDTLFVGDVGRPDLRVALGWSANDLGGLLYDSLHNKLLALPDQTAVYPAHGAGSLCGKALSKETVSTIGEQRRSNYALQPTSKAAFVELVTADQPDAPSYFTYDAVLNSQERPTLDETLERVNPITLDQLLALQAVGAQVLDTRDPAEFAAAHLAGSINIGLGGQYATWAGTVLSREKPIVIIADPGRENEAAMRLGRIGFDQVAGFLQDGLRSIASRPELTMSTERLSAQVAAERIAAAATGQAVTGQAAAADAGSAGTTAAAGAGPAAQAAAGAPVMVDVRAPGERQQKRISGSLGIPLSQLGDRLSELPADRPLLVYCAGGYRSSIAASLLQCRGFTHVSELAGGIAAWDAAKLPLETAVGQAS